jgi:hypothetical protein
MAGSGKLVSSSKGTPQRNGNKDAERTSIADTQQLITSTLDLIEKTRIYSANIAGQSSAENSELSIETYLQDLSAALVKAEDSVRAARLTKVESAIIRRMRRFCGIAIEQLQILRDLEKLSFDETIDHLSKLHNSAHRIEMASYDLLKNALEVSESDRRKFDEISHNAQAAQLRLDRELRIVRGALDSQKAEVAESDVRIADLERNTKNFVTIQTEAMRAELASIAVERNKSLAQARDEITTALAQAREGDRSTAEEHVRQIEQILDKAKLAASKVANATISSYYSNSAKKERTSARIWAVTAVVLGILISALVVTVVILSIFRPVETTFASVLRILAPLIGSPLFIYATLEARQHRKRAWTLDDAAITHSTIGAMIAPLPQQMQHGILYRTASRLYVQGPSHLEERDKAADSADASIPPTNTATEK